MLADGFEDLIEDDFLVASHAEEIAKKGNKDGD